MLYLPITLRCGVFRSPRILLFSGLLLNMIFSDTSYGQTIPQIDPGKVNVEDYSEAEILQMLQLYNLDGLPPAELAEKASKAGFSESQIDQLISRSQPSPDTRTTRKAIEPAGDNDTQARAPGGMFGIEFFANSNLTFQPDMKMATPGYYVLGPGDKLLLNIYGNSEVKYTLEVSPEGYINIPYVGPVLVNGLSVDDARKLLRKQLTSVYPSMSSGKTSFQLALGDIRTIRVTMIGEVQKPAVYNLSSLATIANAVHISGGPTPHGSLREIELIRKSKKYLTFDFYDFLVSGDLSRNVLLQDGDIIKINTYKTRIFLNGAVKRPAYFDITESESLRHAIQFAGGFTDYVSRNRITVYRIGQNEREILNIDEKDIENFRVKTADSIIFNSILNRFDNRVSIGGSVFYPGDYSIDRTKTLAELIKTARIRENTLMSRGILRRKTADFRDSFISFNVDDILNDRDDIELLREDQVTLYAIDGVTEKFTVSVNGEVNAPGTFPYGENLQLLDVILLAGGFKEGASGKQIEIGRRVRGDALKAAGSSDPPYAVVKVIDIPKNYLIDESLTTEILQPYDIVSVRRLPEYREQMSVSVSGEVKYPGNFVIRSNKERLSDLITRSGGLTAQAFPKGAVLMRQRKPNPGQVRAQENKLALIPDKVDTGKFVSIMAPALSSEEGPVGIKLDEALASPGGIYDVYLEPGDRLYIPAPIQTIQAFGAVNNSVQIVYQPEMDLKDAIIQSGGFDPDAKKSAIYVIHSNGVSKGTKRFLFFRNYPEISSGSDIYVPLKKERPFNLPGLVSIGASLSTAVIGLLYLLR